MKQLSLILLALLICGVGYGQKQDGKNVEFNYRQSPLIKTDDPRTYSSKIIQDNIDELNSKRATYQEKLDKAESDYQKALETYKNYSAAEKLVSSEPQKENVKSYFIGSELNTEALNTEYIDVAGFDKVNDGANLLIEIRLGGFEYMSGTLESNEKKTSATEEPATEHYYSVKFRNPVTIVVKDSNGEEIFRDAKTGEYAFKTERFTSASLARKNWTDNQLSVISSVEDKSTRYLLEDVNETLNNQIGFPEKTEYIKFYTAKGKKFDYSEMDRALDLVERGLIDYKDANLEKSKELLSEAVSIWEKELMDKDLDDKKARINEIVATALYMNATYVHTILTNHDKATAYLNEVKVLRPGRFLAYITELEKFVEEYKSRNP